MRIMRMRKKEKGVILSLAFLLLFPLLSPLAARAQEPSFRALEASGISYRAHIQRDGWQTRRFNGERAGTEGSGLRMEAIEINLTNLKGYEGDVRYRSHVQTFGWEESWKKNGETSGTEGKGKRLEAIRIKLTGELKEHYDIYYRVHAQTFGWTDWAKNGEAAGTEGYSKRLEAIEIFLADKGKNPPANDGFPSFHAGTGISYQTHVQTFGWQGEATNGQTAGTEGKAKRLEALKISLLSPPYTGNIEYQSHVQTYGWEKDWAKNGKRSGSEGKGKRLEAIRIRLTGEFAEKCDVWYRVHSQHFGWLGWVKNGEEAGTEGFSYRLEGIQILLLPRDARAFPKEKGFIKNEKKNPSDAQFDVSDIKAKSDYDFLVTKPIKLSCDSLKETDEAIYCHYSYVNTTTGEKGAIGEGKLGEEIEFTPSASGDYVITMSAQNEALYEVSKQTEFNVKHGPIKKKDAFFIAHRGLSSEAPANSLPAFEKAGEAGFASIETDVQETKDGVFVLSHDDNLKNICGKNINISDTVYDELKKYPIIHGPNAEKYDKEKLHIPTLKEYLEICRRYDCIPQIDTKNLQSLESLERLYSEALGLEEDEGNKTGEVAFTSFNNLYLQRLREMSPSPLDTDDNLKSPLRLFYGIDTADYIDADWLTDYQIDLSVNYKKLLLEDYSEYLNKGITISAYTVNDKKDAGALLEKGIKRITTDYILWDNE